MFTIADYKTTKNKYESKNEITFITILKKNNDELIAKIDTEDLEKVKSVGILFAEWHKDFNSYLAQNLTITKCGKKTKSKKRSLQSIILNTNEPIRHINGDTLDNRKCNLEIVDRNAKNDYEVIDENVIAVILKDKYGKPKAKALISSEDLEKVVNDDYTWVYHKGYGQPKVIAHTKSGKVYLDTYLMNPGENMRVHHINLNPLDNRRCNLENKEIDLETNSNKEIDSQE